MLDVLLERFMSITESVVDTSFVKTRRMISDTSSHDRGPMLRRQY